MPIIRGDDAAEEGRGEPPVRQLRVLVIGQVPPPFGGQTIMTQTLLDGTYPHAQLFHVNAAYSTSLADMGQSSLRKLGRLVVVLVTALRLRWTQRTTVLYYHPAGANRSAIYRDLLLLSLLRPMFRSVVFHLHARGLPEAVPSLPRPLRALARRCYRQPDMILGPSQVIVQEAASFEAKLNLVAPNGTAGGPPLEREAATCGPVQILFLNLISEAKGAAWLLDAVGELRRSGIDVELSLAGEFASPEFRDQLAAQATALGIVDRVHHRGLVTGAAKWELMASADIFCVPTTWPQESFGLAMIEAASCGLPVVTADVPGVRELFTPGESVLLADPNDRTSLGPLLEQLCNRPELRAKLGAGARAAFKRSYTLDRYWSAIDDAFAVLQREANDGHA